MRSQATLPLQAMSQRVYHKDGTQPLESGWIWVFGSNLAGRHGAGAARVAAQHYGAQFGVGRGPTGRSYAIATKDAALRTLPLSEIALGVAEFLRYAGENPHKSFFVTRVGCVLAGYQDDEIAPMFSAAPANCSLPDQWRAFVQDPAEGQVDAVRRNRFPKITP